MKEDVCRYDGAKIAKAWIDEAAYFEPKTSKGLIRGIASGFVLTAVAILIIYLGITL